MWLVREKIINVDQPYYWMPWQSPSLWESALGVGTSFAKGYAAASGFDAGKGTDPKGGRRRFDRLFMNRVAKDQMGLLEAQRAQLRAAQDNVRYQLEDRRVARMQNRTYDGRFLRNSQRAVKAASQEVARLEREIAHAAAASKEAYDKDTKRTRRRFVRDYRRVGRLRRYARMSTRSRFKKKFGRSLFFRGR